VSAHGGGDSAPLRYAIRLQERAVRDITAAYIRIEQLVTLEVADQWRDGLRAAVAGLAAAPRRYPLAPEKFSREVRHLLYRRTGSRAAYRVLFTISGEDPRASNPPTVTILHVRHAAARSITRHEARAIASQE
jgi:plasmid stabilization system protein ParE